MSASDLVVNCPLCGTRYREAEGRTCRTSCPLARACGLLRCPRCHYEVPRPSALTRVLARWLGSAEAAR